LPTPWSENIPLVRPLLGVWRDEILAYLAERNLEPIKDPSNQDVAFLRNSVRHELIPSLEEYNPKVRQAIWNTANVLREDFSILESSFGDAWQECLLEEGSGFISFNIDILKYQPVGIQRYIFRGAMALVMPDTREIDYGLIRNAIDFLNSSPRTGECELTEMVYILKEDQYLWVYSKDARLPDSAWPQFKSKNAMELDIPGKLNLNENWMMEAVNIRSEDISQDQVLSNQNPFRVFIDVSKVKPPLVIRNRRPGDRIKPLGMKGKSMKLAHFMVNQKLPRRARENWPLVCDSEEILWVPGYRSSHISRVSEKTKNIIILNLVKGDGS
jgi:tRNA(Ile)-lysidine synthase